MSYPKLVGLLFGSVFAIGVGSVGVQAAPFSYSRAAVEVVVREESVLQDVHGADSASATLLHGQALEQLRLAAEQHELATDRITETPDATALLEEVQERVALDAITGLVEEARVS